MKKLIARENNNWNVGHMPNLEGTTAIVTGANSGIGLETSIQLAHKGAHVVMACRNADKGRTAVNDVLARSEAASVELAHLDLADLSSVRDFTTEFSRNHHKLDLLVNNAGVMFPPYERTKDNFEMQVGTNHLGHFALTGLLLSHLFSADRPRVVTVSSIMHKVGRIDFTNFNAEKSYSKWKAYAQSKLANLLFAYELQRLFSLTDKDARSIASHPGGSSTGVARHSRVSMIVEKLIAQNVHQGALPSLRACTDPEAVPGSFYGPANFFGWRGPPTIERSSSRSYDEHVARELWQLSTSLTGVSYNL